MSDTATAPAVTNGPTLPTSEQIEMARDTATGLRALADLLDREPLALGGDEHPVIYGAYLYPHDETAAPRFHAAIDALDATIRHDSYSRDVIAEHSFGPVKVSVRCDARAVCTEREVLRTDFVLPPDLAARVPAGEPGQ